MASLTLLGLCIGILFELDREGRVHREVLAQMERNDRAENVRGSLGELAHAVRLAAATGTAEASATVDRLARDIESGMREAVPVAAEVEGEVRLALLNARSVEQVRRSRGAQAAEEPAREAERRAQQASALLDRDLNAHAALINRSTAAQLRMGAALRTSVVVALIGSLALLVLLYALYGAARRGERAALARIEHLAQFDSLTGLPNRPSVTDRLQQEIARSHRHASPFALLLFDLDGFKRVNDTWGHAAGDEALAIAANRARAAMRASDIVGRIGGDEFLAVLPETALDGAIAVAEKLREALERPYELAGAVATMSVSIGIAIYPHDGQDAEALQHAADAALYVAKRSGRNRYQVAGESLAVPA